MTNEADYDSNESKKEENNNEPISLPVSQKLNQNNPALSSILKIREFFLEYSFLYILLKILIGGTFLILPFFLFRKILTDIHNFTEDEASYYIYAFLPMIIVAGGIMVLFFGIIVYKLFSICCGSKYKNYILNFLV